MAFSTFKLSAISALLVGASLAQAAPVTITIESWRSEDQSIWDEKIAPAFEAKHPNINVEFKPTTPTEYNAALSARLEGGTAGDLITCRPFDNSLAMYDKGYLADIKDLPGLNNFSDVAKGAWATDDASAQFCVPMASVIHAFMYNKDAFAEMGLSIPKTEAEFYAVLDAIKADGSYTPMAMGTKDQWEAATMGYTNVGPTYWGGEDGRLGVIDGSQKLTDDGFVEGFRQMAKWSDYLGNGFQAQGYTDSQNLFTLGRAAIYPTGSWEITGFLENAEFEVGVFAPPAKDASSACYISDHTDIGMGMNSDSKNPEAVRTFLEWMTSSEFAGLLTNAAPGFFSLANHDYAIENSLAKEFVALRGQCKSTIRLAHQILSRGEQSLGNQLWTLTANVINGSMTPEQAAGEAQANLATWYAPQQ